MDLTLLAGDIGRRGSIIVYKLYLGGFLDGGCGLDQRLCFQEPTAGSVVRAGHGDGSIGRYVCDLWFFLGEEISVIVELGGFLAQRAAVDSGLRHCLIGLPGDEFGGCGYRHFKRCSELTIHVLIKENHLLALVQLALVLPPEAGETAEE